MNKTFGEAAQTEARPKFAQIASHHLYAADKYNGGLRSVRRRQSIARPAGRPSHRLNIEPSNPGLSPSFSLPPP
ncbi:hypothetical protein PQR62_12540 [Herbaspirillum lusitanum]|uniref:Uncharacterized protein n=1 Tax=Herbaspirillum lusitanum TaxID=213312 RepID=A0ABW9A9F9_9BURK